MAILAFTSVFALAIALASLLANYATREELEGLRSYAAATLASFLEAQDRLDKLCTHFKTGCSQYYRKN